MKKYFHDLGKTMKIDLNDVTNRISQFKLSTNQSPRIS